MKLDKAETSSNALSRGVHLMMTKDETIEAIRRLNPTADPMFLAGFAPDDLDRYLRRLCRTPISAGPFAADEAWNDARVRPRAPEPTFARAPTE